MDPRISHDNDLSAFVSALQPALQMNPTIPQSAHLAGLSQKRKDGPDVAQIKAAELFLSQLSDAFLEMSHKFARVVEDYKRQTAAFKRKQDQAEAASKRLAAIVGSGPKPPSLDGRQ
eukprot:TRINITY_DN1021_c0_g2_i1.p1 TRINITY_DN1021_c0_g2~~TRINITY_DN1021_c0_g2_i1.p1  ORF type:complete len:117 (-),score=19.42 TRINITY_DN1021_c0_g2_i1:40-390(-)